MAMASFLLERSEPVNFRLDQFERYADLFFLIRLEHLNLSLVFFSPGDVFGCEIWAGAVPSTAKGRMVVDIPLDNIRRPLMRTRANDQQKVKELMDSISEIGLQVPIDVLEVDGVYYGFSGCHRYEAHQKLGLPTIRCKVRRGTKETLRSITFLTLIKVFVKMMHTAESKLFALTLAIPIQSQNVTVFFYGPVGITCGDLSVTKLMLQDL
ncbi:unnamed protein product [Rhodiola kirilowii]